MLTLLIPGAVYWFFADRKNQPLYGFHARGVALWPYFILLALMIPLIIWASTQADFLRQYPTTQRLYLPPDLPYKYLYTAVYELCYGLDFLYTEFFFRGLIIIGLIRWAGHHALLPMCAFYVTIHFDKPMVEAISSFFGGYLLAILAYYSRSIYGGVIVHLGVAWLMDIIATIALSMQ
jgi:membrane protease YdiL (CAAX protease family)